MSEKKKIKQVPSENVPAEKSEEKTYIKSLALGGVVGGSSLRRGC